MIFRSYIKLGVLCELKHENLSGYDLMKRMDYNGKKPSAGYMYPLLQDLLDKGYVSFEKSGRRKIYKITAKGIKLMNDLRKNSEVSINNVNDILEPIIEKDELESHIKFYEKMKKFKKYLVKDMDVFGNMIDAMIGIYEKKDPKLHSDMREMIIKTTKSLERTSKRKTKL